MNVFCGIKFPWIILPFSVFNKYHQSAMMFVLVVVLTDKWKPSSDRVTTFGRPHVIEVRTVFFLTSRLSTHYTIIFLCIFTNRLWAGFTRCY